MPHITIKPCLSCFIVFLWKHIIKEIISGWKYVIQQVKDKETGESINDIKSTSEEK